MTRRQAKTLATFIVGALWTLAAYMAGTGSFGEVRLPQMGVAATSTDTILYPVVHVVDGDTIDVLKDGQKVRVRLIGINAPESVDPRRPVQCFGREASAEMKRFVGGQSVALETDPSQDLHDKYGRLLAYVFLADPSNPSGHAGSSVNLHMIEAGYAYEYTYDLPYRYQREFKRAQADVEQAGRGLWAAGACGR